MPGKGIKMRLIAVAALIAACLAGAAIAQESGIYDSSRVQWEREPDIRAAFRRYMPDRAAQQEVSGAAHVCCTVDRHRRLACVTARETLEGYGFGESTARVMRLYQMTEASYAEWQANPLPIARSMSWHFGAPNAQHDAQFAQFREESRGACLPSATPAPIER